MAGLQDVVASALEVRLTFTAFQDWWHPFTLGVGPAGAYVDSLDDGARAGLAARCPDLLGPPPFDVHAVGWCVRGTA